MGARCVSRTDVLYVEGTIAEVQRRDTSTLELLCGDCIRRKHGAHATMSSMSHGDWSAREPTMAPSPMAPSPEAASAAPAAPPSAGVVSSFNDSDVEEQTPQSAAATTTGGGCGVCIPPSDCSQSASASEDAEDAAAGTADLGGSRIRRSAERDFGS